MTRRSNFIIFAAAILAAALTAGAPAQALGICTALWAPVCALKSGVEQTYSNSGCAKADDATIERDGRCRGQRPGDPRRRRRARAAADLLHRGLFAGLRPERGRSKNLSQRLPRARRWRDDQRRWRVPQALERIPPDPHPSRRPLRGLLRTRAAVLDPPHREERRVSGASRTTRAERRDDDPVHQRSSAITRQAAHIGPQRVGDGHGAVRVLVVFEHGDERAADRNARAIERMDEARVLCVGRLAARIHPTRLEIAADRAGGDFAETPPSPCPGSQTSMSWVFCEVKPMSPVHKTIVRKCNPSRFSTSSAQAVIRSCSAAESSGVVTETSSTFSN